MSAIDDLRHDIINATLAIEHNRKRLRKTGTITEEAITEIDDSCKRIINAIEEYAREHLS